MSVLGGGSVGPSMSVLTQVERAGLRAAAAAAEESAPPAGVGGALRASRRSDLQAADATGGRHGDGERSAG